MFKETNEYKEMRIEFDSAIATVQVERGLSNIEGFKERYQKAFDKIYPNPRIAFGNKKIPETTAIVNTTSWFLCPGRLQGFCELHEVCYDKCREVMGSVNKSRLNHDLWWRTNDAKTIATFISYSIMAEKYKGNNINLLRFQEVGDFRNQEDLTKMRDVSNLVYELCGVKSYTYTHNRKLDFGIDRPHLTINGSGFMIDNQFTVVPPSEYERYVESHDCFRCPQKCEMCNSICSQKLKIEIVEVEK
ncbi:MAG: hypothetical protein IKF82_02385 [Bacilli bacterium]|nr:hypothetical protein [Bacilli bacterium]